MARRARFVAQGVALGLIALLFTLLVWSLVTEEGGDLAAKAARGERPEAPDFTLETGDTIPVTQTSTAVQLDEILTTLQAPDRENLQKLLQGYGTALNYQPTAADDKGQDPDVQGESAAEATNDAFVYGATGARDTAIVNEALLGEEPDDLSQLIA